MYALFKDGKQISIAHKFKEVCCIEAFELKLYNNAGRYGIWLQSGCEIKKVNNNEH